MSLSDERQRAIADLVRVAATWVDGERTVKLLAAAHELEGADEAESGRLAQQELYDQSIAAAASSGVIDAASAKSAQDAFDNAPKAGDTAAQGGLFQPGVPAETPNAAPTDGSSQGVPADQAPTPDQPVDTSAQPAQPAPVDQPVDQPAGAATDGSFTAPAQDTPPTPAPDGQSITGDGTGTALPPLGTVSDAPVTPGLPTDAPLDPQGNSVDATPPADQPADPSADPSAGSSDTTDQPVDPSAYQPSTPGPGVDPSPADTPADTPVFSQVEQTNGDPSADPAPADAGTGSDSTTSTDSTASTTSADSAPTDPAAQ